MTRNKLRKRTHVSIFANIRSFPDLGRATFYHTPPCASNSDKGMPNLPASSIVQTTFAQVGYFASSNALLSMSVFATASLFPSFKFIDTNHSSMHPHALRVTRYRYLAHLEAPRTSESIRSYWAGPRLCICLQASNSVTNIGHPLSLRNVSNASLFQDTGRCPAACLSRFSTGGLFVFVRCTTVLLSWNP